MPFPKCRWFFLLIGIPFLVAITPSWALRPIFSQIALVAGAGGFPGFQDGTFTQAKFNRPMGLAINQAGTELYVADSGNNRIRVVHLDQDDRVTTLAGNGTAGKKDGRLEEATFNKPHSLALLPGNRLAVNDYGNLAIRVIDLDHGTVETLSSGKKGGPTDGPASLVSWVGIRDMVYFPSADSLVISQPAKHELKRLDLKTGLVSTLSNVPDAIPNPSALAVEHGQVLLADQSQPVIFEMTWNGDANVTWTPGPKPLGGLFSMTQSGDRLYGFQGGEGAPLQRLKPNSEPVTFMTTWGDIYPQPGDNLYPFAASWVVSETPSIIADPTEDHRIFVSNPNMNIICNYRDLYGNRDVYGNTSLIEPPVQKPPRTFRILFVGDSRSVMIVTYPFVTSYNTYQRSGFPPQISVAHRLETDLNIMAAMEDAPQNFEVISLSHSATEPLFLWPTYEVPANVKKYDIDLVVIFQPPTVFSVFPYKFYFMNPITKDGIPLYPKDVEYLLKSPQDRIPPGEGREFYELCRKGKYVKIEGHNFVFDEKLYEDPALHDVLVRMYGKPLAILKSQLDALKTSTGQPVRLLLCSTHTGAFRPNLEDPGIWTDVAKRYQIPFLDTNDTLTALRLSVYPLSEVGGNDHLNPDGHFFFGFLLAHELIKNGWLPWDKP